MKRTFKHSIQRFGIGAASFGLAVSVLFPSAAFANSSLESSTLVTDVQSQSVTPHNYAGILKGSAPVSVIVELTNKPVSVYVNEAKLILYDPQSPHNAVKLSQSIKALFPQHRKSMPISVLNTVRFLTGIPLRCQPIK